MTERWLQHIAAMRKPAAKTWRCCVMGSQLTYVTLARGCKSEHEPTIGAMSINRGNRDSRLSTAERGTVWQGQVTKQNQLFARMKSCS